MPIKKPSWLRVKFWRWKAKGDAKKLRIPQAERGAYVNAIVAQRIGEFGISRAEAKREKGGGSESRGAVNWDQIKERKEGGSAAAKSMELKPGRAAQWEKDVRAGKMNRPLQ